VVKKIFFGFVSFWSIIKLIATLFVIFIMTHMFRVFSQSVVEIVAQRKWATVLVGTFSFVVIPIVILILFASLVLIPVSVILALIFMILIILLPAMSAIILGYLYRLRTQRDTKVLVEFNISALFLIVLTFVGFVPYVGGIVIYLLYVATFGAMVTYLYEQIRRKKIKL
jgi:hypothetical protein